MTRAQSQCTCTERRYVVQIKVGDSATEPISVPLSGSANRVRAWITLDHRRLLAALVEGHLVAELVVTEDPQCRTCDNAPAWEHDSPRPPAHCAGCGRHVDLGQMA